MLLEGCRKTDVQKGRPLAFNVPAGFPQPVYNFQQNPTTEEGFLLGKKLFYDGRLSKDGNFACGSCHQQVAAFTTFDHDRSHGYNHAHTLRNAPALSNLAWYPAFRQDGSAASLESVALAHILASDEMAESIPSIVQKLKQDATYKKMFRETYGSESITPDKILNALTQFLVHMVSTDSKYDQVKIGTVAFTAQEQNGYALFQSKCASCHTEPLFTDFSYRNTGLPIDAQLKDYGRMRVTGNKADSLKFRVPSLRNLDYSSYYAHDGRFSVFRMMIQHYRSGVIQSPSLDPLLINGIPMTMAE
ncbi:MAG: cytochrome-c peroxidase, partial [Flavisolibacter sp.]|nr:cytochrome-c peroxidase [Flavisolibacter sp.]